MKNKIILLLSLLLSTTAHSASWTANISKIQAEGIKDPYNVIYLKTDINSSACDKSNSQNRLTLVNEIQHSTALAALMANKVVTVQGSGVCNAAGLENINYVMIYSDK
ncbi:hypothetical protein [Vibrio nigripulchritudo]|uniref:hypothetical protein n=1 Tax=Vibrio nigripulchritudo TaxID=28173 RepID=UPI002491B35B|nr:hypothetical protein [Vibrio nigripulchritudo]BDU39594.1 hypothetical protein TUMSATVNIG2_40630 [Vibrio nigripulchritudo]BDU45314.1 hypothetical protein TUMSATVNIG3_41120 [Vibrio nigripulchritudo]